MSIIGRPRSWPPLRLRPNSVHGCLALDPPATESLPPAIQSRWIDATTLPTRPLEYSEIRAAVLSEVALFQRIFGSAPKVVVPPTFIWNDAVESAWAEAGVQIVVSPGRRYESRDAEGRPAGSSRAIINGQIWGLEESGTSCAMTISNRCEVTGRRARLKPLLTKARTGRPRRCSKRTRNFLGDPEIAAAADR